MSWSYSPPPRTSCLPLPPSKPKSKLELLAGAHAAAAKLGDEGVGGEDSSTGETRRPGQPPPVRASSESARASALPASVPAAAAAAAIAAADDDDDDEDDDDGDDDDDDVATAAAESSRRTSLRIVPAKKRASPPPPPPSTPPPTLPPPSTPTPCVGVAGPPLPTAACLLRMAWRMFFRRFFIWMRHFWRRSSSADSPVRNDSAVRRCAAARPASRSSAHPSPSIAPPRVSGEGGGEEEEEEEEEGRAGEREREKRERSKDYYCCRFRGPNEEKIKVLQHFPERFLEKYCNPIYIYGTQR